MKHMLLDAWRRDKKGFLTILVLNIVVSLTGGISIVMLIPMLGATFLLGEGFGPLRIIGSVLTLIALLFNTDFRKREEGVSRKWGVAITLTFLFNGAASFFQKWFAVGPHGTQIAGYNFFSYVLAALLGLLLLFLLWRGRGITPSSRPTRGFFFWCFAVGLILGTFQWFFTYSQRILDASLLLPTFNGATTALMAIIGILLFRERPTVRRIVATCVGVAAIVVFGFAR
jgi:drug/metabolite transporter (DMT)-like permease